MLPFVVTTTTRAAGPETLRERAIQIREGFLDDELRRQARGFRTNEVASADEWREASERLSAKLRRELETLRAMPADVSDDDVRSAMGVA